MKIRIGRIELAFVVLLAVYLALAFSLPPNFWLVVFKFALLAMFVVVLTRISHELVRQSLWRLRNRLMVAYFFIAVVPIVLITALLGFGAWMVAGQLSTFVVTSEFERRVASLRSSAEFLIRGDVERDDWVQSLGPYLQARYPGVEITVEGRAPWQFPVRMAIHPPPEGWADNSGLMVRDERAYGWTHLRQEGRTVTITFPLTREFLGDLAPGLGEIGLVEATGSSQKSLLHPAPVRIASRNRRPPAVNWMDVVVFSTVPMPVAVWDSPGKFQEDFVAIDTRPSALLRMVFSQRQTQIEEAIQAAFWAFAILFFLAELAALYIGISITKSITGAVHDLDEGTQRVTKGDFSHRIPDHGGDQMGGLVVSFNQMTGNLERLLEVEKERQRLHGELAIAREVQNQLYPKSVPKMKSMCLTAHCDPARLVSGDYYDYQQIGENKIAVALGDVCGKGISAALLMATIQSSFRMQLRISPDASPSTLVSQLNKQLHAHTAPEKFATFFFGIYDEPTSTLTYTNAGALPPILIHNGEASRLEVNGLVVGAFDFARYEESKVTLDQGDLLVFFTDGISEPENEYGEMFGEERLMELSLKNAHLDDARLAEMIIEAAKNWTTGAELQDDMTLLLMRRRAG